MIKVDYTRDALFDTLGLLRLKQSYMRTSELYEDEGVI